MNQLLTRFWPVWIWLSWFESRPPSQIFSFPVNDLAFSSDPVFPLKMGSMPRLCPNPVERYRLELKSCVSEVALVYDIVAIKYRPGFMAGDVHGDAFGYPCARQVAPPVRRRL